jgi:hypothetical protein
VVVVVASTPLATTPWVALVVTVVVVLVKVES